MRCGRHGRRERTHAARAADLPAGLTAPAACDSLAAMSDDAVLAQPMSFTHKIRVTLGCALAMALFGSLGWAIARPADPQDAMTMLGDGQAWPSVVVLALALAAVSSAVATAVAGTALQEAGTLATACGLAMMSLRGGTMTEVLMYHGATESARRTLATRFAAESLLWFAVIAASWLVGIVVRKWLDKDAGDSPAVKPPGRWELLREAFLHVRDGILGLVVCAAVAWVFIASTIARTPFAATEQGQVFFAVGVGFFLGAAVAQAIWVRSGVCWYAIGILLVAVLGYAWGFAQPVIGGGDRNQYYAKLATTPPNALFRALPIDYAGIGVVGIVLGQAFGRRMHYTHVAPRAGS